MVIWKNGEHDEQFQNGQFVEHTEGPRRLGIRRRADDRRSGVLPRDSGGAGTRAGRHGTPDKGRGLEADRQSAQEGGRGMSGRNAHPDPRETSKPDAAQQPTSDPKLSDPGKTPGSG